VAAAIAALSSVPAGVVSPYAGSSAPTGWLLCDGAAISRSTYATLFTAISTTFGAGDGSTTFNVPDMRGRMAQGAGAQLVTEDVTAANVSTGAETFTVASNTEKWITGMKVQVSTTTTLPAGLSASTTYYIIRVSSTLIQFATTLGNAISSPATAINLTTQGTGTHTVSTSVPATSRSLGAQGGYDTHAVTVLEMPAHTHLLKNGTSGSSDGMANIAAGSDDTPTASSGGSDAHNNMSPFTVLNHIIKT
jgi:microcystin-dependent protein